MDGAKGLFLLVSLLSSMLACVLCSRGSILRLETFHQLDNVPTVVKGLDLERYVGRWYEIASLPTFFMPKDGTDTRATYALNKNGTVDVLNETWVNGKRNSIKGIAYKDDPNSDEAKLKLKFYVPPEFPIFPIVGDYWVLYLDADYQYSIVGGPSRKSLFILSRKSHVDDETYKQLVQKAVDEGYDVSNLRKTPQSDTPPQ
ncbi:hypothetical protein BT93_I0656 [Corymbia citriodora subsp. variegata]|nr:hypothetical protein BT93_I0656 [Corymbia citriodora subsp. variegata]